MENVHRQTLAQITNIAYLSTDPIRAERAMRNCICSNVKLCKRVLTKDMLNDLYRQGIGTNEVEVCVKRLCKNMVNKHRNLNIVKSIMKEKVKDAHIEVESFRKQLRHGYNELHRYIQKLQLVFKV